ncbi:hypothetical protein V8V91_04845 [Algoriphagus halophilus]|uniref:hypothetical protein n=1 Tax=Algoriphagus halophilus TaxID=226505 RepID=UPI00358DE156
MMFRNSQKAGGSISEAKYQIKDHQSIILSVLDVDRAVSCAFKNHPNRQFDGLGKRVQS